MILATKVCSRLLLRSNRRFCAKSDRIFDTRIASATKWEFRPNDKFRRAETEKSDENSLSFVRRRHRCLIIRSAIGRKNKTMLESHTSDQIRTNARPVTRCRLSHPISASPIFFFLIFQTSSGSPLPSDTLAAGSLPAIPVSHNFHRGRCMYVGWECSPGQSTGHRSCQEEKTEASDALTNVSDCTISTLVTTVQVPDELLDRKSISDSVGGPAINVPILIVFQLYDFPRLLFLRFDSLAVFPVIQRIIAV